MSGNVTKLEEICLFLTRENSDLQKENDELKLEVVREKQITNMHLHLTNELATVKEVLKNAAKPDEEINAGLLPQCPNMLPRNIPKTPASDILTNKIHPSNVPKKQAPPTKQTPVSKQPTHGSSNAKHRLNRANGSSKINNGVFNKTQAIPKFLSS